MNLTLTEQLKQLRLSGLHAELTRQQNQPNHYQDLSFEERLSLLIGYELTQREQRRIERLVNSACKHSVHTLTTAVTVNSTSHTFSL